MRLKSIRSACFIKPSIILAVIASLLISGMVYAAENELIKEFEGKILSDSHVRKPTTSASETLLTAQEDYAIFIYSFQKKTFEWQLFSSKIIFCFVISLVFIGLFLSGLQFYLGFKSNNGKAEVTATDDADHQKLITTIEASKTGIKISSPVLGVIILTLSLAFLYLYLTEVYPISYIPNNGVETADR